MCQLIVAYKRESTAPAFVADGGYFPHDRGGEEWLVGIGTGHVSLTPMGLLEIALTQPGETSLKERITEVLNWLERHGCDYPEQIDLSRPPAYGVESYVRNAGPDRFGVHGAKAPPISVQSRIRATG